MSEEALRAAFADHGIAWDALEHPAVFTVEESAAIHDALPGAHTKNLFLKDAGGAFWLVTVDHARRVDLKALASALGARKLSFGKAEDMERLLGVTPGSVTPLAAINDREGLVRVVIDADLAEAARVNVHPLRNTATVGLSGSALRGLLAHWGHEPLVAVIAERA
ncbi:MULTISPECIES: prolyl-tRNA synthetase associated domain-containing protein [unclassified Sphingomonas]|uniref:prolyl-tRNA synthetase associated domain-containing protein n=1 Tax=unclassified Sphingomonas TaxID=196159 RepID=UPI00092B24B8|nr:MULTISPECIES: prolyl-tRNA synthetase associated domain-containing protein [unclassified Sphingomonas]MBN8847471.1 prolyl-tRNA synthetase associated domain-containing protein [Sphingomonas sp.]OJV32660.1 MAG: DNA-binding protein [Sphingomonas sp. 67-36]